MKNKVQKLQKYLMNKEPEAGDAIVWLQGDRYDRGKKVLVLFKEKYAPLILLSGNNVLLSPRQRPGEKNISLPAMKRWLIKNGVKSRHIIVDDKAMNTKGQAMNVISLAQKKRWKRIIIAGSIHHQLRAFLTFLGAADTLGWKGKIINQPFLLPWDKIPGGRNKSSRAIFRDELKKIYFYHQDAASFKRGEEYIKKTAPLLRLRTATERDAKILLKWRNDPTAYANFFNARQVSVKEHQKWLKTIITGKKKHLYIIIANGRQKIGQIRFDEEGNKAEISVTLAKEYRGGGYGVGAISSGVHFFLKKHPKIKTIIAQVKSDNPASVHAFLSAGFKKKRNVKKIWVLTFHI